MMRAFLLAVLVAACAAPPPAKGNSPNALPLAGTRWVMQYAGDGAAPTIEFREAGRASGFTGCNQWFAQVDRTDGGLRFNAVGMTRRACEALMMDVERDFADALRRTQAAQLDERTLTLIGENGEVVARFDRAR